MKTYFEVKAKYKRNTDNGVEDVTELYIVEAVSVSYAEHIIVKYLTPYCHKDNKLFDNDLPLVFIISAKLYDVEAIYFSDNLIEEVEKNAQNMLGTNRNISAEADTWFACKAAFSGIEGKEKVLSICSTQTL